jgi:DNA polymerase-3 subunit delta'
MTNLSLHPKTRADINSLISSVPHGILITGASGIGKKAVARYISEEFLGVDSLEDYPYALVIGSDKSIGIDSIRQVEHFLSLKVPNDKSPNRIVLIEDSEKLTLESQNALLKNLEEPPEKTVVLMTLSHVNLLLPTLRSRAQRLHVVPPDEASLRQLYSSTAEQEFNQAYLISGGLPGLLHALLTHEDHPLKTATTEARSILSKSLYERSLMVNSLSKDASRLLDVLQIMEQMATVSLRKNVNPDKWQKVLSAAYDTKASLSKNAQTKLTLLKLMFSL